MESMSREDMDAILESKRGPKTLVHDETVLETETEELENRVIEHDGKKLRLHVFIRTTKTKHVRIREYDPEKGYEDGIHEFTASDENE